MLEVSRKCEFHCGMKYWKITEKRERGGFTAESPDYADWRVFTTKDGCCELQRFYNGTTYKDSDDMDQIHLCDIDETIDRLIEIRNIMRERGYE